MNTTIPDAGKLTLGETHVEDLKLAASKMFGAERRSFHAAMTLKYCGGSVRQAEMLFGWNRHTVELGLHERRTGVTCLSAHKVNSGNILWEKKQPEVAEALWALAQSHSQQDPTFRTTLSYTRLTAAEALKQLRIQGFAERVLPSPSTMADVLNRNGCRLRPVVKAKPQKKSRKRMPSSPTCGKRTGNELTPVQPDG
jgi:Rhodopirellula transposase DDE domain